MTRIVLAPTDRLIRIVTPTLVIPKLDGGQTEVTLEPGEMKRVVVNGKPIVVERLRPA